MGKQLGLTEIESAIASWRRSKGFFHQDSDVEFRILPLSFPSAPIGFKDRKYRRVDRDDEELGPQGRFNILSCLIPWRPFAEHWPWGRIRELLRANPEWHHFKFYTNLTKKVTGRISGEKITYFISCYFLTQYLPDQSDRKLWSVYISVAPVKEWRQAVPGDDPRLVEQISNIARQWAELIGVSHLIQAAQNAVASNGKPGWIVTPGKPDGYDGPYLALNSWSEDYDKPLPEFVVPGDFSGTLPQTPYIRLTMIDLETALKAYEIAFRPFFGDDPHHEELRFTVLDPELPEFKQMAEPVFGSPWLQEMGGFAQPGYVPQLDDSVPDWTIQPVAYFKILGSWRVIDLLKEPGGWRFIVTGKYTKDPLKHRHIRDELARKAGMTSETLWEPQEAGEGWLGVPG